MEVGFKADTELVIAKLKNADADMRDLTKIHKAVGKIVLDEWKRRVPVRSGKFQGGGRVKATQKYAAVNAAKAGPPYAGVAEFGGKIPRHQGKADHKSFTLHKPPASSIGKESYFLYPARDDKMPEVVDEYTTQTQALLHKHGF